MRVRAKPPAADVSLSRVAGRVPAQVPQVGKAGFGDAGGGTVARAAEFEIPERVPDSRRVGDSGMPRPCGVDGPQARQQRLGQRAVRVGGSGLDGVPRVGIKPDGGVRQLADKSRPSETRSGAPRRSVPTTGPSARARMAPSRTCACRPGTGSRPPGRIPAPTPPRRRAAWNGRPGRQARARRQHGPDSPGMSIRSRPRQQFSMRKSRARGQPAESE